MDNRLWAEERHLAKTTPISFSRGLNLYSVVSVSVVITILIYLLFKIITTKKI